MRNGMNIMIFVTRSFRPLIMYISNRLKDDDDDDDDDDDVGEA
jgi:hypothetical protein